MNELSFYRVGKGLSPGAVAASIGLTHNAIERLENGTRAWRALTYDQLIALAAIYGIALSDLLDRLADKPDAHHPATPADAAKVEAVMVDAREGIDRDDIAIAFGWTLERTQAAIDALIDTLRDRGQSVAQLAAGRYRLMARPGLIDYDEQTRLQAARGRTTLTLGPTEATVLRVLLDHANHSGSCELFDDPAERVAVGTLIKAGMVFEWGDSLCVSSQVAFSLYEHPLPPEREHWTAHHRRRGLIA